jgi:rhodanese-related sulfurtransferase
MPLFLVEGHPAAVRRIDLGERLARIRQARPGALVNIRAEPAVPRLEAVVEALDSADARAVWAMGSLASHGVRELEFGREESRAVLEEPEEVGAAPLPGPDTETINHGGVRIMEEELILARAQARGEAERLPYAGALTPEEAWLLLKLRSDARLLDVRSQAERELVGRVPGALEVEFMSYPAWQENPDFLAEVRRQVAPEALLLLICRSGQRSHQAALQLRAAGHRWVFNVLEGFEGDKDAQGRRTLNGWRLKGLPWEQ